MTLLSPLSWSADKQADERIRAQFLPLQQSTLSAELSAKLSSLPFHEGDSVKAGQLLAAFDCSLAQAQLRKAQAAAQSARQTLKVNQRLAELGSISALEVDLAEGKLKEADAEIGAMRATLSKCKIHAPFAGSIAKQYVDPHEFVGQGKPILDLIDHQNLEIKLVVPSRWLSWLNKGSRFTVQVDELGRELPAVVTRLGSRIDPVSQSISVIAEPDGRYPELLPGMSGWASFNTP